MYSYGSSYYQLQTEKSQRLPTFQILKVICTGNIYFSFYIFLPFPEKLWIYITEGVKEAEDDNVKFTDDCRYKTPMNFSALIGKY